MLLKSLNYWSAPGGLEGKLDVFEFLKNAADNRFPAVELAVFDTGSLPLGADEAFCLKILGEAERLNVKVASLASGLYWSHSLGDAAESSRLQAAGELEQMIQIASWLKVNTLLTIPGSVDVFFLPDRAAQPSDEVYRYATEGLRALLPLATECRVRLGIENVWNKFLLSPLEMAQFIDQFNSPWIGSYFDVGNILPYGHPQDGLRVLGKRVVGIHFKDFRRSVGTADGFVDLLEGDVDWPEVMKAIREIGYDGPIVAEMIPGYRHHPMVRIANTSNAMDAILGSTA